MRRVLLALFVAGLLVAATASPALAFHHIAVPADECAAKAAVTPGNNEPARDAIKEHNPALETPLPPADTSFQVPDQAPDTCPPPE